MWHWRSLESMWPLEATELLPEILADQVRFHDPVFPNMNPGTQPRRREPSRRADRQNSDGEVSFEASDSKLATSSLLTIPSAILLMITYGAQARRGYFMLSRRSVKNRRPAMVGDPDIMPNFRFLYGSR